MEQSMYMHVVPNSHAYGSLRNFLIMAEFHGHRTEEMTKEYVLIGLRNTLKHETEIRIINDANEDYDSKVPVFTSVSEIIKYLEHKDSYTQEFLKIIKNTLNGGLDLKSKFKMEKSEVYKKVDGELEYQQLKWVVRREKNGTPDESKPPAEWINYMEWHLSKAKERVYMLDDEEALAEIRKVVALGVRALTIHGCPERVIPEELLNEE